MGMGLNSGLGWEPVGTVKMMVGITQAQIPNGWLWCDGSSKSTTAYPALFSHLGYRYGGAGGNFTLPEFKNRFPVGTSGNTGGFLDTTITGSHTFQGTGSPTNITYNTTTVSNTTEDIDVVSDVYATGSDPSISPYVAVTFMIKY